jgi:hypothetical protein
MLKINIFLKALIFLLLMTTAAPAGAHGSAPPSYYVNASTGNDANPGTQALPWLTLHKVNITSLPFKTTVSLQGTFSGGDNGLIFTLANALAGYVTVTSYGTGATIQSGNSTACYTATNLPGMLFSNVTCVGGGNFTNTTPGVWALNNLNGNATLQGPTFTGLTVSNYGGSGILVSGENRRAGFTNGTISSNVVHDVSGNSSDSNHSCIDIYAFHGASSGYGFSGVHSNMTVNNNLVFLCTGTAAITTNWTGSGIFLSEVDTATVQFNVAHDTGGTGGFSGGGVVGIWTGDSGHITIQFNESYNQLKRSGIDADGFDFDGGVHDSIMQYNYSHNNAGFGINLFNYSDGFVGPWSNNLVRYNVTEHNVQEISLSTDGSTLTSALIYNNTLTATSGSACLEENPGSVLVSSVFKNNICVGGASADNLITIPLPGGLTLDHNNYTVSAHFSWAGTGYTTFAAYQSGASQDANSNVSSTTFTGTAGTGGTCYVSGIPAGPQPCPSVYQLQGGSAQRGVGVSISSPGSRDYYGNAIPNGVGTGYNIGAYGN